jgi:hypothetical protein
LQHCKLVKRSKKKVLLGKKKNTKKGEQEMKKINVLLACFLFCGPASAVKMPDAQTLKNNLKEAGLADFDIKTRIAAHLAGQDIPIQTVVEKIAEGLDAYAVEGMKNLQEQGAGHTALSRHFAQIHGYTPDIAFALLKGNAAGLAALKKIGILQSNL